MANGPTDDSLEGERIQGQTESKKVPESVSEKKEVTAETNAEVEVSKQSVISSSQELNQQKQEDDVNLHSLGKFNYLFYFIYKHKYQDNKMLIEQELEDKL